MGHVLRQRPRVTLPMCPFSGHTEARGKHRAGVNSVARRLGAGGSWVLQNSYCKMGCGQRRGCPGARENRGGSQPLKGRVWGCAPASLRGFINFQDSGQSEKAETSSGLQKPLFPSQPTPAPTQTTGAPKHTAPPPLQALLGCESRMGESPRPVPECTTSRPAGQGRSPFVLQLWSTRALVLRCSNEEQTATVEHKSSPLLQSATALNSHTEWAWEGRTGHHVAGSRQPRTPPGEVGLRQATSP